MRNLFLLSSWVRMRPYADRLRSEEADEAPRSTPFEDIYQGDLFDGNLLATATGLRRLLYRLLPGDVALTLAAFISRKRYRVVIAWTDTGALLFALLLMLRRTRQPLVAMMFWISRPWKARLLKLVHGRIDRIILWTSAHRDFAVGKLGVPASKIAYIPHYVDDRFFRPMPVEGGTDMICSAGREMRDYPTLIAAMRGLDIRCHIAAGVFRGKLEPTVRAIYRNGPLPENVTVGLLPPDRLRAMYARSRFVVVPLLPTDSDNGLSVILEAMAMGKAVICSRVEGQRDVIREGTTGVLVPQGDPLALRRAIQYLWNNEDVARTMGKEGRLHIERHHSLDWFAGQVRAVIDGAALDYEHAAGAAGRPSGASEPAACTNVLREQQ